MVASNHGKTLILPTNFRQEKKQVRQAIREPFQIKMNNKANDFQKNYRNILNPFYIINLFDILNPLLINREKSFSLRSDP